jgi:hypothetical protein
MSESSEGSSSEVNSPVSFMEVEIEKNHRRRRNHGKLQLRSTTRRSND